MNYYVKMVNSVAVLLVVALCSFQVNAETMSIGNTYAGYASSDIKTKYIDTVTGNLVDKDTFAGLLLVNYEGYNTWGFCVDLNTPLVLGTVSDESTEFQYTTTFDPGDYSNNDMLKVEWLLDKYGDEAYDNGEPYKNKSAALQLAIWEVLYDDDFEFVYTSGGPLSSLYEKYETYIDAFNNGFNSSYVSTGNYVVVDLQTNQGGAAQDIIVKVVPEPTTALLLGFGLLGLCAVGRKRA